MNKLKSKILNLKLNPPKTPTGIEAGWMVVCKIKHRALLWLSFDKPRHFLFPVGLGCPCYTCTKDFFGGMSLNMRKLLENLKEIMNWWVKLYKPMKTSQIIKKNHE